MMCSMDGVTNLPAGLCLDCNYSLRGLYARRCPECGRHFDPGDPSTMNMGKPHGRLARAWMRPVRGLVAASTTLTVAVILYSAWQPARLDLLVWIGIFYVVVGLPAWLFARVRRFVVKRYRQPLSLLHVDRAAHRRARMIFAAAALLLLMRLPFRAAFFASYWFLDNLAVHHYAQMPMGEASGPIGRLAGLFYVEHIDVEPSGATVRLPTGATLVYRDAPPQPWYGHAHIYGNWYYAD